MVKIYVFWLFMANGQRLGLSTRSGGCLMAPHLWSWWSTLKLGVLNRFWTQWTHVNTVHRSWIPPLLLILQAGSGLLLLSNCWEYENKTYFSSPHSLRWVSAAPAPFHQRTKGAFDGTRSRTTKVVLGVKMESNADKIPSWRVAVEFLQPSGIKWDFYDAMLSDRVYEHHAGDSSNCSPAVWFCPAKLQSWSYTV